MAASTKNDQPIPVGEPFARLYLERSAPAQDNPLFRNRLEAYLRANHYGDHAKLTTYLKQEGGLIVPSSYLQNVGFYYNFPEFFEKTQIEHVLSAITFIWRFLRTEYPEWKPAGKGLTLAAMSEGALNYPQANAWHAFVERVFREENMAYSVDEKCGVHYFVDEEFERNRVSALKCVELPRYSGVRAAFQAAHGKLERIPPDTKGSIRDIFEAAETLTKLVSGGGKALDAGFVRAELEPRVQKLYTKDAVAQRSSAKSAQSFADWIDAVHPYRHGHGAEAPIAPPLELTVLLVSQGASFIRWLVDLDLRLTGGGLV